MQPLTAPPRDGYTAAQMTALLTAPDLQVDYGASLLDASLGFVDDLSPDVSGGTIQHDNLANVHSSCTLQVSRALAWGRDKVQPYMLLSSLTCGLSGVRFNLGVFVMVTPDLPLSETPATFQVTGYDQLFLLQNNLGDSLSYPVGANVLTSVKATITAAGITAPVLIDTTASTKTLTSVMTWPVTSSDSPTYLKVVNDLLASIGYRGVWCDQDGAFRSSPYVLPSARPSEFDLQVGDLNVGIVASERVQSQDLWGVPNWYRYVANGYTVSVTEGAGQYTVQNASTGLSSQASVGRVVRAPVQYLDAVDQSSLVVQGDRLSASSMRVTEVLTLKLSPLPCAWHADRFGYLGDEALGGDRQVVGRSWSLPLTGEDMSYVVETV